MLKTFSTFVKFYLQNIRPFELTPRHRKVNRFSNHQNRSFSNHQKRKYEHPFGLIYFGCEWISWNFLIRHFAIWLDKKKKKFQVNIHEPLNHFPFVDGPEQLRHQFFGHKMKCEFVFEPNAINISYAKSTRACHKGSKAITLHANVRNFYGPAII